MPDALGRKERLEPAVEKSLTVGLREGGESCVNENTGKSCGQYAFEAVKSIHFQTVTQFTNLPLMSTFCSR